MTDNPFIADFDTVTPAELLGINCKLLKTWYGETLPGLQYVRSANPTGKNIPLFWVLQTNEEFARMTSLLPQEQPVHALRSMVFHRSKEELERFTVFLNDDYQGAICEAYLQDMNVITQGGPYLLGGNCGAATIALNIALRAEKKPDCLFVMNIFQDGSAPYNEKTELLFGSEERAKFEALPVGPAAFPNSEITHLEGNHGSYFRTSEAERIASVVARHIRVRP